MDSQSLLAKLYLNYTQPNTITLTLCTLLFTLFYSCGIAVCDTYVLQGKSYWLSNVCSICQNAGFLTVLKGCISLAI